jgi:hypothetical protein
MLCMCVYMHFRFVENHPIRILEDGPLISEGVVSQSHICVESGRNARRFLRGHRAHPQHQVHLKTGQAGLATLQ